MIKRALARRAFASCIDLPAFEFNRAATCALNAGLRSPHALQF